MNIENLPDSTRSWYQNKSILVTGAAGFLGSHLSETLVQLGATVLGVDSLVSGFESNIEQLKDSGHFVFKQASVSDPISTWLPATNSFDAVFHLASLASPPLYQADPVTTYLANSLGTHQLLEYIKNSSTKTRFFFASTSEVYGEPQVHPQPESYWGNVNPNGVRSCYDESKRLGETICGVFFRDFGVDVRIVRIFNTYGPKMNPHDGRVIPAFIGNMLEGKPYAMHGDGSQTRSYCFVDDLIEGFLLYQAHEHAAGETINLGNPEEYSILKTAKLIHQAGVNAKLVEHDFAIDSQPRPKDDPSQRKPDITKAKTILNWQPRTSFATGLQATISWFSQHKPN